MRKCILFVLVAALAIPSLSFAERVKDLASIAGVRSNQLFGYGLVVGLNGTGDRQQAIFSAQTLRSMLREMGVVLPPGVNPGSLNVAAV
jgi:flagellar P-ring protein precursor FlgI